MLVKALVSIVTVVVLSALFSFESKNEVRPAQILLQMYDSIKNVKTVTQDVVALERVDNKYSINRSAIKVQMQPRKIYYINPAKKLEVLYNVEKYDRKAWVKPHIFPYLTLSLDPRGNIMRRNQHYSILELGYEFIGKSIALTLSKDKHGLDNFIYHGKVMKNGYHCYFLEYENKNYSFVDYVVGNKETASLISLKLCVNDYLLRDKNNLLNDFGYLKKGTILKVPTLYCQKAILYIDEQLMLPVAISLYDDKGLFESYEYSNIQINKPFKQNEFDKEFARYNF
jgi:hypothetical protein